MSYQHGVAKHCTESAFHGNAAQSASEGGTQQYMGDLRAALDCIVSARPLTFLYGTE